VVPLRNVWLVYTIEVYDLIVIYLHTPHTIPNKLAIKLARVAVCPIHPLIVFSISFYSFTVAVGDSHTAEQLYSCTDLGRTCTAVRT
jgi:hypothetical protein